MRVTITFSLNESKDKDLVQWLGSLEKGEQSRAIRQALRSHLSRPKEKVNGVTLAGIQALLRAELASFSLIAAERQEQPTGEDQAAAAAIDADIDKFFDM